MTRVTSAEFARVMETDVATVSRWIGEGMPADPYRGRGKPRMVNFAAAHRWLLDRAVARAKAHDGGETLRQAELRKLRADADLAEAKVAALREQMAPTVVARAAMAAVMAAADARLAQMVERVAPLLATEADPATVRHVLFLAGRQARQQMAGDLEPDGGAAS